MDVYSLTALLAFFLGILLGLLSIGGVILRQTGTVRLGWACVAAGFYTLSWLVFAAIFGNGFTPTISLYVFSLAPAYLGGVAIVLDYGYQNRPPPMKGAFSLLFLFYLLFVVRVLISLCQLLSAFDLDAGT